MILLAEISKLERRAIFGFALLPLAFFAIHLVDLAIQDYNLSVSDHQYELYLQATGAPRLQIVACDFGTNQLPAFSFLSLFIFLTLIRPTRFIAATALTMLCSALVSMRVYRHFDLSLNAGVFNYRETSWGEMFSMWYWDIVGVTVALPMLIWLVSIVWRLHRPGMTLK